MIAPPEALVSILEPWNKYYGHSKAAETIVTFVHVGGLLLAGGLAIAADRGTLRALRVTIAERPHYTRELAAVHQWVLSGLVAVVVSGVAMLAADIETFWSSWIFWTKMALFVVLLINGLMMTRAEAAIRHDPSETSPAWTTLHRTAVSSLALWFVLTALGLALVNFS
jgi:uncharacterized membrane protein